MPTRPRRPEQRTDIRLEAALLGALGLVVALVGWFFFARSIGAGCGQGCLGASSEPGQVVLWLVVAVTGSLATAAAYVVSAVSRLLDAQAARPTSFSAASASD